MVVCGIWQRTGGGGGGGGMMVGLARASMPAVLHSILTRDHCHQILIACSLSGSPLDPHLTGTWADWVGRQTGPRDSDPWEGLIKQGGKMKD